jgi:glutathione synthase/RimK-type ligase-like ATP-grasp enzyme
MNRLYILDSRDKWVEPCLQAAQARGYLGKRIYSASDIEEPGYALIFPHANPQILKKDQAIAQEVAKTCTMITDLNQIMLYENKRTQTDQWWHLMPRTWMWSEIDGAVDFAHHANYPLVSKADVGASSYNVRILKNKAAGIAHAKELFGKGIQVEHCDSMGTRSVQKGYAIFQEFIPHQVTYRVNVIGNQRAIFHRFCYPDKPVAQTGNVKPVYELDAESESLLAWVEVTLQDIQSNWVALDVLKHGDQWLLLETSLRWPWPSPGDCNNATFFPSGRKWIELWDVLINEIEAGAWAG